MSVARPARSLLRQYLTERCLLRQCPASPRAPATTAAAAAVTSSRTLHSSAPRHKRRTRFRNILAEDLGLIEPGQRAEARRHAFPDYTEKERQELHKKYTPAQIEAIEAAEKAVDPDDMLAQGRMREDPYRPKYIEDFTMLNPKYDVQPELEVVPEEKKWLSPSEWVDEFGSRVMEVVQKRSHDQATRALVRALRSVRESAGHDFLDLTPQELDEMEANPALLEKHLVPDGEAPPKPAAVNSGGSSSEKGKLTRDQFERLNQAVDEAWLKEMDKADRIGGEGSELQPSQLEMLEHGPAGSSRIYSAEAPELGKVPGVEGCYKVETASSKSSPSSSSSSKGGSSSKADDEDYEKYERLRQITGLSINEIKSLVCRTLVRRMVHNQTRLGKVRSSSVIAIAGNGNGWLGLGMAKSTDATIAGETANLLAIRNMKPVRRYENRTIYGNVEGKEGATVVKLYSRPPGFGLRVPHRIFEMCRAVGLHDMAARMPRSRNPMNSVKATYQALMNQPDPEDIAIGRGRKLVDVRKVYFGGLVH